MPAIGIYKSIHILVRSVLAAADLERSVRHSRGRLVRVEQPGDLLYIARVELVHQGLVGFLAVEVRHSAVWGGRFEVRTWGIEGSGCVHKSDVRG